MLLGINNSECYSLLPANDMLRDAKRSDETYAKGTAVTFNYAIGAPLSVYVCHNVEVASQIKVAKLMFVDTCCST